MSEPIRIANCSGFYGDRLAAAREMVDGGPIDVLTGDWLAELTMLVLAKNLLRDNGAGYARTFVTQMEQVMGQCLDRGIKVVSNAGGLTPDRCAEAVAAVAAKLGLHPVIAYVEGDNLVPRLADLRAAGASLANSDTGEPLGDRPVLTANAYLGGWGIAEALARGADIVITGRVTDAALALGPAAWHHGWRRYDWDALAGAVVAGHVIECGAQATGGNYAFFTEHPPERLRRPGFPLAELHDDGSSVITKHDGTGGVVDVGTVTAQLLYETAGARYAGPDVTARLDTARLTQEGPDRVRIEGVRGEAPPPTLKVGVNRLGGFRNEVVFVLTGLDIEAKAALVRAQMEAALDAAKSRPGEVRWELARTDHPDAATEETASALLRLVVRDRDQEAVGRALSGAAVELALASYPGFHVAAPPGKGEPYGLFEAVTVGQGAVTHVAVLHDGRRIPVPPAHRTRVLDDVPEPPLPEPLPPGPIRRAPLGLVAGARSGDKGGSANVGVWARTDDAWRWLAHTLTVDRFRELLPETADLPVVRHVLPNLRALNFVVEDLLGEGVAARHRFDPQAKGLGEWLRARHLEIPEALL